MWRHRRRMHAALVVLLCLSAGCSGGAPDATPTPPSPPATTAEPVDDPPTRTADSTSSRGTTADPADEPPTRTTNATPPRGTTAEPPPRTTDSTPPPETPTRTAPTPTPDGSTATPSESPPSPTVPPRRGPAAGGTGVAPGTPSATFLEDGARLATVTLEVADTPSERRRGLMGRDSLASDHGMVFVFEEPAHRSFWMRNTTIALDIIFVGADFEVLNIEAADPEPDTPPDELERYTSDGPAQYVIEVDQGFADAHGVGPGTTVRFDLDRSS